MNELRTLLSSFWNGFLDRSSLPHRSIHAFPEGYPQTATSLPSLPYITFNVALPTFSASAALSARVWTRSDSFALLDDILAQIAERIPDNGLKLSIPDQGFFLLLRSNPFLQYLTPDSRLSMISSLDADPLSKTALVQLSVKNYSL